MVIVSYWRFLGEHARRRCHDSHLGPTEEQEENQPQIRTTPNIEPERRSPTTRTQTAYQMMPHCRNKLCSGRTRQVQVVHLDGSYFVPGHPSRFQCSQPFVLTSCGSTLRRTICPDSELLGAYSKSRTTRKQSPSVPLTSSASGHVLGLGDGTYNHPICRTRISHNLPRCSNRHKGILQQNGDQHRATTKSHDSGKGLKSL